MLTYMKSYEHTFTNRSQKRLTNSFTTIQTAFKQYSKTVSAHKQVSIKCREVCRNLDTNPQQPILTVVMRSASTNCPRRCHGNVLLQYFLFQPQITVRLNTRQMHAHPPSSKVIIMHSIVSRCTPRLFTTFIVVVCPLSPSFLFLPAIERLMWLYSKRNGFLKIPSLRNSVQNILTEPRTY